MMVRLTTGEQSDPDRAGGPVGISRISLIVASAALVGGVVVAPQASGQPPEGTAAPAAASAGVEVRVMSQNIMYGGDEYDLETGEYCPVTDGCPQALRRIARIIDASGADIVGVQEPERNIQRLADRLGWHASPTAHVISRYPIIEPPRGQGVYVFVEVSPGKVVAVSNVHLISSPYGPDAIRDGATLAEVLRLERQTRLRDIQPQLEVLPKLVARGFPVILVGDFNTPSQLDWTSAVAQARPDVVKYPVRWPVGVAVAKAGFVDSYREAHPDPVAKPAFTWTPGGPEGTDGQIMDRIDWILHAGPVSTLDSQIVGEQGGPDVDLGFPAPYPTDHRGVISTFALEPRQPPVYASTQPRPLVAGETVRVSYHLPARLHARIQLVERARGALRAVATVPSPGESGHGAALRVGRGLHGRYLLVARARGGDIVSRQPLFVYRPGEDPTVDVARSRYGVGEPIGASWSRAPGMRLDWIGVIPCRRDGSCRSSGWYVRYSYTTTRVEGSLRIGPRFGPMEGTDPWPLKPGQYVLRLFVDDSYQAIAHSQRFTIHR